MKACVVIPIYKPFRDLDIYEKASLQQCFTILKKHKIYFICSSRFDPSIYVDHAKKYGVEPDIKKFPSKYFKNIEGYNKLMLNENFYKSFLLHRYMLVYQTDAFVFKDELDKWCSYGIDYIGAPWIEDYKDENYKPVLSYVGNGGYSLRNIHKHYKLARHIKRLQLLDRFLRYSFLSSIFSTEKILLSFWETAFEPKPPFFIKMLTSGFYANNEDGNWGMNIALGSKAFIVADINMAIRFSFEKNPEFLFEKNNRQLPFGCHAFRKYNWSFWSQYINVYS